MALLSRLNHYRRRRRQAARDFAFEWLEHRNMPAVLVDVGLHMVEPDMSGQTIELSVESDAKIAGFDLRAQIVTTKLGPHFEGVRFAGDLWNSFPHVESGSPFPADRTLASGEVAFTQGFEAQAEGTLVTLTIDTTGIPAGSYPLRLVGTKLGDSSFRQADDSAVSATFSVGTLQVRSIWQNPVNTNDTNGDGRLSPLDVLLVLNELSKTGSRELPMPDDEVSIHFDVNGDGHLTPLDALSAINCLNGVSCVSTPQPILAQVTSGFAPDLPDSTGVGKPFLGDSKSEDPPPGDATPSDSVDCVYHELDEDGNPIPITDPEFCQGSSAGDSTPPVVGSTDSLSVDPADASTTEIAPAGSDTGLPATSSAAVLSPRSVDAVFDLAKKVDEATSDELVDLGLSTLP